MIKLILRLVSTLKKNDQKNIQSVAAHYAASPLQKGNVHLFISNWCSYC